MLIGGTGQMRPLIGWLQRIDLFVVTAEEIDCTLCQTLCKFYLNKICSSVIVSNARLSIYKERHRSHDNWNLII